MSETEVKKIGLLCELQQFFSELPDFNVQTKSGDHHHHHHHHQWLYSPSWPRPPLIRFVIRFYDRRYDALDEWSARRKACTYTEQYNIEGPRPNIHTPSEIRTRDPAYERPRPKPKTARPLDRLVGRLVLLKSKKTDSAAFSTLFMRGKL
jgi:hypothetical protein